MSIKIRDLSTGRLLNNDDYFVVALDSGTTVKIPYFALASAILTNSLIEGTGITISENQGDFYSVTISAVTPTIDPTTKHWIIGETDTGIIAEGQDGAQGSQGIPGNDGYSISATSSPITGGNRVTLHSTDPSMPDTYFDVMDGSVSGYIEGNGITISGSTITANIGSGLNFNSTTGAIEVSQIASPITVSDTLTLTTTGWDSVTMQQTVSYSHNTTKRNVIDITPSELPIWGECQVYAVSETDSSITFLCSSIPSYALTFKVTSMEVST